MTKQENSYSLWLRPAQEHIDDLTKIISKLAHRYRTLPFPAHITLLSSITTDLNSLNTICKSVAEKQKIFDIALEEVAFSDVYFKILFINARPEKELLNLHEILSNKLNHDRHEDYLPHISLLYGMLDEKTQQALKKELDGSYLKTFNCQRLDIYNTTHKESEWHLIKSFNLT